MKHRLTSNQNNPAFTLVELLLVIAIVGILGALSIGTLSLGKVKGRQIQCINNLHQLGIGLQQFVGENKTYPLEGDRTEPFWMDTLEDQLYHDVKRNVGGADVSFMTNRVWVCPAAKWPPGFTNLLSYGYNAFGVGISRYSQSFGLGGTYSFGHQPGPKPAISDSAVVRPAEMFAIGDGFVGNRSRIGDGTGWLCRIDVSTNGAAESTARAFSRHRGCANIVFCDGHVGSPTLNFLFSDTNDAALACWNRDHLPHRERLAP